MLLLLGCETDLEKLKGSNNCVRCYLKGVDLTGAELKGANLNWSFLEQAHLDRANLANANLNGARLAGVSLQRTVMTGVDIRKATLINAVMNNADLRQADLTGALWMMRFTAVATRIVTERSIEEWLSLEAWIMLVRVCVATASNECSRSR